MTRVLPAFVVALLAIAPSAGAELCESVERTTWAARSTVAARPGAEPGARQGASPEVADESREQAPLMFLVVPRPATAFFPLDHSGSGALALHGRVVDGRALARRLFVTPRAACDGADDPDSPA